MTHSTTANTDLEIRSLHGSDLDSAESLLERSFPRPANRRVELERALRLQPDTWFLATAEGVPAGMVGAMVYDRFSWIGLMAVAPEKQSRGVGRALMMRVLEELDRRHSPMVLLDASEAGFPLYRSLGFVEEDEARVFELTAGFQSPSPVADRSHETAGSSRVVEMTAAMLPHVAAFDAPVFGATRLEVLSAYQREFPRRSFVAKGPDGTVQGFIIVQARRIGPWVASSTEVANSLLERALCLSFDHPPQVIVAGHCPESAKILRSRGFAPGHANRHMRRGGNSLTGTRSLMFGQGSFAIG